MFCSKCGQEVVDDVRYCPNCGQDLQTEGKELSEVKPQAKCWTVFANVGYGLALAGVITCWLYAIGLSLGATGLVFSILGKKSYTEGKKAQKGVIMGIVATVIGFIATIVTAVVVVILFEENGYYF